MCLKLYAHSAGIEVNRPLSTHLLVSNFTFWFGLEDPSDSLLVGGWSIGVEMVFYVLFPVLMCCVRNTLTGSIVFVLSCLVLFLYSQNAIDTSISVSEQWEAYSFGVTHLPFFTGGILLYFLYRDGIGISRIRTISPFVAALVCMIGAVILMSVSSYADPLIGNIRYVWIVVCMALVLAFALWGIHTVFLLRLGDLSYSIYLYHFFVFLVVDCIFSQPWLVVAISVLGTYACSTVTYKFLEIPMSNMGKRAVKKIAKSGV